MTNEEARAIVQEKMKRLHELQKLAVEMGVTEPQIDVEPLGGYAEARKKIKRPDNKHQGHN